MTPTAQSVDNRELVKRGFRAIERPGSEDLAAIAHPEFRNWEAVGPAADLRGQEAFAAAVEMLNRAFLEPRYEVMAMIAERDLVAVRHADARRAHRTDAGSAPDRQAFRAEPVTLVPIRRWMDRRTLGHA